jgi:Spy/CpxP family protein refolding chaperone
MRVLCTVTAALAAAALFAGPVPAANHHGGRGAGLLLNPNVQQELKLDKTQVDQVTAALKKVHEDYKDDIAKLHDRNLPQDQRAALADKVAHASRKAVKGILRPEQAQRFAQIRLQVAGVDAFVSPKAEKALKLTESQKQQVQALAADLHKERHALFQGGPTDRAEAFKKMRALREEKMSAAVALLTPEQKTVWKDLIGEPFHFEFGSHHPAQ